TAGGQSVTLNGMGMQNGISVWFGGSSATVNSAPDANHLLVTAPSAASPGAADILAKWPDGRFALAPEGFSYGPVILDMQQNAGPTTGNTDLHIVGYGFGSDPAALRVTIGGAPAT